MYQARPRTVAFALKKIAVRCVACLWSPLRAAGSRTIKMDNCSVQTHHINQYFGHFDSNFLCLLPKFRVPPKFPKLPRRAEANRRPPCGRRPPTRPALVLIIDDCAVQRNFINRLSARVFGLNFLRSPLRGPGANRRPPCLRSPAHSN